MDICRVEKVNRTYQNHYEGLKVNNLDFLSCLFATKMLTKSPNQNKI